MFYNAEMLTKRGPLARVWMASHLSTKLTKTNLLATSIPSSVSSILGEALLPMALRLSGQLLLGVARIYSRKAKYLLDDCNETLSKVKKAFRPGQVDMEEVDTGARGGAGGITLGLQEGGLEDILNQYDYGGNQWDFANIGAAPAATGNAKKAGKANVSNKADITLPDHSMAWDDNYGAYGDFDNGIDGGIDSQVDGFFDEEFELGILDEEGEVLDFDEEGMPIEQGRKRGREEDSEEPRSEGDMSVEAGRHASVHASDRGSIGPFDLAGEFGKDADGDVDMGGMDGNDFGGDWGNDGFDMGGGGPEEFPEVNADREQTPAAPSINGDLDESLGLTPKTAADLAKKKDQPNPSKKPKLRKQVVDAVTELEWQAGRNNSVRFKEPTYLPSSRLHLRLLELESDPSNYLPKPSTSNTELFAPLGIASELEDLYSLPTRRQRIKLEGRELVKPAGGAAAAGQEDVELGRERQESLGMGAIGDFEIEHDMGGGGEDLGGWDGGDFAGQFEGDGGEGFQFDLGGEEGGARDREATPKASASQAARKKQKVHGSTGGSDYLFDEEAVGGVSQGPLAIFDVASAAAQASQAQQSSTQAQSLAAQEEEEVAAGGAPRIKWSKNTKKAIKVLQDELAPVDEEEVAQEEPKKLNFEKVAQKATRRAASSFFFELLVLSTRECVRIEQPEAYGSIEVQAKEKLWDSVVADEFESQSQAIEA